MVCSNFHSTRVCKLCLFLFAQFIVPYQTNDSHSEIHGVGIHSIERIINNAQGYSSFSVDGCTFVAELTIPFLDLNN